MRNGVLETGGNPFLRLAPAVAADLLALALAGAVCSVARLDLAIAVFCAVLAVVLAVVLAGVLVVVLAVVLSLVLLDAALAVEDARRVADLAGDLSLPTDPVTVFF